MENVPIYVKVDHYEELLEALKKLETKLSGVKRLLDDINTLKTKEDAEIARWNENLTDVTTRVDKVKEAFYQK